MVWQEITKNAGSLEAKRDTADIDGEGTIGEAM